MTTEQLLAAWQSDKAQVLLKIPANAPCSCIAGKWTREGQYIMAWFTRSELAWALGVTKGEMPDSMETPEQARLL